MKPLPKSEDMPTTITIEKPATNLASLSVNAEMIRMRVLVVGQWQKRDEIAKLARHGIHPIRQILFYGPPGNGKTCAAQWLAHALSVPLFRVRSEMIVSSYHGETAHMMRRTLDFLERVGHAVVLFDEIETLFQSRELAGNNCSQERHAAMATLWQALDRWSTPQLFLFATNMESKLDPAMLSRFEFKLEFGPPTPEQCRAVIDYWSEVFHEYGADEWSKLLYARSYSSFRELWLAISAIVRERALGGIA